MIRKIEGECNFFDLQTSMLRFDYILRQLLRCVKKKGPKREGQGHETKRNCVFEHVMYGYDVTNTGSMVSMLQ